MGHSTKYKKPTRFRSTERTWMSFPKSIGGGSRRQKQPFLRQHFLKRLPELQGQRSFRPSFSSSSLSPWTTRTPRLTCVSDGNPRRRLLMLSKKWLFVSMFVIRVSHGAPPFQCSNHRHDKLMNVRLGTGLSFGIQSKFQWLGNGD